MSDSTVSAYAKALLSVATAEGSGELVETEIAAVADALRGSQELSSALNDQATPVGRRMQILEDVLGGKVSSSTLSLVTLVASFGRIDQLDAIANEIGNLGAETRGEVVAEVRSAVALSEDQKSRLAEALGAKTNRKVAIRNVVDPAVVGGFVAEIGDTLIDGSIRTRLNQLREAF